MRNNLSIEGKRESEKALLVSCQHGLTLFILNGILFIMKLKLFIHYFKNRPHSFVDTVGEMSKPNKKKELTKSDSASSEPDRKQRKIKEQK